MIKDRQYSVCFTGHRILKKNINVKELDAVIEDLIKKDYYIFYNGMAMGFDLLCFERLLVFKKKYPHIKIVACIPFPDQPLSFNKTEAYKYSLFIDLADDKIIINDKYTLNCYKERDRFMVDNSSICISYLYKSTGGTYYTTTYAIENNLQIIYIK